MSSHPKNLADSYSATMVFTELSLHLCWMTAQLVEILCHSPFQQQAPRFPPYFFKGWPLTNERLKRYPYEFSQSTVSLTDQASPQSSIYRKKLLNYAKQAWTGFDLDGTSSARWKSPLSLLYYIFTLRPSRFLHFVFSLLIIVYFTFLMFSNT